MRSKRGIANCISIWMRATRRGRERFIRTRSSAQLALENQFTEARAEFEQVIRLQPDYAPTHLNLGMALMKAGKFSEAGRAFEEAVRLEPGNPHALNYLNQARAAQAAK